LPREAIAITFDDGYASVARVAAPLLQKYGAQATVFLPAGLIPRRREFWWDDLERIVFQTTAEELSAAGSLVQLGSRRALDRIWLPFDRPRSSRQKAFRELWARMSLMRDADRERLIDDLRKQAGVPDTPRESHEPMNIEQLRSLLPDTIDFGSHGLTHPDLLSLNDEEQAREIRESIDACEELTGRSPRSFAYPHGRFDELSVKLVQEAGYQLACSAKPAFVNSRSDQFTLPRLAAGDWRIDDFRRRLFGTR
jgi:peptidoglycan/xylan/chitin deacetylase (PgdA/CDA1 family)